VILKLYGSEQFEVKVCSSFMFITQYSYKHLPGSYVMRWAIVQKERVLCDVSGGVVYWLHYRHIAVVIIVTNCIVLSAFVGGFIHSHFILCLTMINNEPKFYVLFTVHIDIVVQRKPNLMHNLFLVSLLLHRACCYVYFI
jgi:hypothetical protein